MPKYRKRGKMGKMSYNGKMGYMGKFKGNALSRKRMMPRMMPSTMKRTPLGRV